MSVKPMMVRRGRVWCRLVLILCGVFTVLAAGAVDARSETRSFVPGSLAAIEQAHAGQPFLMKLWSVDCPPCVRDLALLRGHLQRHPALRLVLVSVDESTANQQVAATLQRAGLDRVESWVFAHRDARRLRGEIDPQWYGELPRTYFYDAAHRRIALTGPLTDAHLSAWLEVTGD